MNYFYSKLLWECDFPEDTPLRRAFSHHLVKVAAALKAIEWVDSGDWVPGDEDDAILAVLGSGREVLESLKEIVSAADGDGWNVLDPSFKRARAAIAKVEGRP